MDDGFFRRGNGRSNAFADDETGTDTPGSRDALTINPFEVSRDMPGAECSDLLLFHICPVMQ
jgi:ArsR family metal-binding transcriptional regulator